MKGHLWIQFYLFFALNCYIKMLTLNEKVVENDNDNNNEVFLFINMILYGEHLTK